MHGLFFCSSVFLSVCVFNVWPKTTLLFPVWPRDAGRLDTPERDEGTGFSTTPCLSLVAGCYINSGTSVLPPSRAKHALVAIKAPLFSPRRRSQVLEAETGTVNYERHESGVPTRSYTGDWTKFSSNKLMAGGT